MDRVLDAGLIRPSGVDEKHAAELGAPGAVLDTLRSVSDAVTPRWLDAKGADRWFLPLRDLKSVGDSPSDRSGIASSSGNVAMATSPVVVAFAVHRGHRSRSTPTRVRCSPHSGAPQVVAFRRDTGEAGPSQSATDARLRPSARHGAHVRPGETRQQYTIIYEPSP